MAAKMIKPKIVPWKQIVANERGSLSVVIVYDVLLYLGSRSFT